MVRNGSGLWKEFQKRTNELGRNTGSSLKNERKCQRLGVEREKWIKWNRGLITAFGTVLKKTYDHTVNQKEVAPSMSSLYKKERVCVI